MIFKAYRNKFGKQLIVEESVLSGFLAIKSALDFDGIELDMCEGWRGQVAQDAAKASGNSRASFGHSPHNYGVAFDAAPIVNGKMVWPSDRAYWDKIGQLGKSVGLVWGGDFKTITDLDHFELKGWKDMGLRLFPTAPQLNA